MHEGDLQTEQALPRLGVDQLRAGRRELRNRRADVVHLVGDVVHPGAPFRQEPPDGRVLPERGEELDPVVAHADRRRLDALLLDAGSMLEPAAEQPLVRLHRLVEVRHGNADVMDASSVHRCDAIRASVQGGSMGRRLPLALLLLAATLAGCGGSGSNGEASKSASTILADARRAALAADSVRVAGTIRDAGQAIGLDLTVAKGNGGGTMTIQGSKVDVVRVGDTAYIRARADFYSRVGATPAAGRLLAGKWLKLPTSTPNFAQLVQFTDLNAFVTQALKSDGTVTKGAEKTVGGQKAIELKSSRGGSLFVAASGKPYPIEFVGGGTASGTVTLSDWGSAKAPSAPKNAIDINALGK